ncbi:MAG: hypothetical protein IPH43_11575 [Xanthomonadales bacterium]|uniref:hypothetical protein n=1 Tax=Dokdonella sp. TaxID=2291710 RepID=UPI002D09B185|nr:hypothetical protein [Xanthomonadales bacterium]HQV72213.1 hypothetical protein [Dokdonella sp.]MBK7013206.1 hypothetical protein [Xanthomonadales bacterium]MBK7211643.1 hypothetical protein [Xanthomonadales bacterium]MBL0221194.1 hypothetical protein [Xanthomonadales bacterium]
MQRWVKIPDGRFLDANRIAYVGKIETFNRIDEDGTELGLAYAVNLGTDFPREAQINVVGTKDEIFSLLRGILGGTNAPPADQV